MEYTRLLICERRSNIKLDAAKLLWLFVIGCVVGTLWEELLTLIAQHRYESRAGLLIGPFSPVYGIGAVAMTAVLAPLSRRRAGVILFVGALTGGTVEYVLGFMQQALFGTISWDYSDMPLNIGGRTNAAYMLFWGVAGLLWLRSLPKILAAINRIPHLRAVTLALAVFMALNVAATCVVNIRANARRGGREPSNPVERWIDDRFPDERMSEIYPNADVVG